ncbi:hypothetical protein [Mycobacterium sp. 050134]|uniref:hypothetical protein n=1 Tax=Mycobacterium sp. 050134 TaxID=3096111 RepID=UPI002ED9738C
MSDLWDAWDDFHPSIAWGNIATVTVAIAAIVVSARFNVLTLRSADKRFQRERLDARDDKLRGELAVLLSAVGEFRSQQDDVYGQLFDFINTLDFDKLTDEQLQEPASKARSLVFAKMGSVRRRINICGITIHILTTNAAITRPVELMREAVRSEQRIYGKLLAVPAIRGLTPNALKQALIQPDTWFELATQRVIDFCIQCLGTDMPHRRSPSVWNNPWG